MKRALNRLGLFGATILAFTTALLSAGCGGSSSEIPTGVAGTLLQARVQASIATVSVGSSQSSLNQIISAIGKSASGSAQSFSITLKGASYDRNDAKFFFETSDGTRTSSSSSLSVAKAILPADNLNTKGDGSQIYVAGTWDGSTFLATDGSGGTFNFATGTNANTFHFQYYVVDRSQSSNSNAYLDPSGAKVTIPATNVLPFDYNDPTNTDGSYKIGSPVGSPTGSLFLRPVPFAFTFLSLDQKSILQQSTFDVVLDYYSGSRAAAEAGSSPSFWSVYFKAAADTTGDKVTISYSGGGDPSLTYSSLATVNASIDNLPTKYERVEYYVREIAFDASGKPTIAGTPRFSVFKGSTDGGSAAIPVVNRLRPFVVEAIVYVKGASAPIAVASAPVAGLDTNAGEDAVANKTNFTIPVGNNLTVDASAMHLAPVADGLSLTFDSALDVDLTVQPLISPKVALVRGSNHFILDNSALSFTPSLDVNLAAFDTDTLLLKYVPGAQVAKQDAGTLDASLTIIGGLTPLTASKPVNAGVVPENKVSVEVSLDPASTFGDATTTFNPLIRLNGTPRFAASNGSFDFPGSIKLSVIEDSTNDVTSATPANRYFVGSGGTISDPIGSVSLTPGVRAYKRKIELVSNDDGTGIAFASGTTGTSEIASANTQKVTLTETALIKSATVSGQSATSGTPFIARAGETWSYAIKASAFTGSPGSPTFTGTAVTVPVGFVNPSFVAAGGGFIDLTGNATVDQVNGTFTINSGFKTSLDVVGRIKLTNLLDGRNSVTIFVKIKANQGTIGGGIG